MASEKKLWFVVFLLLAVANMQLCVGNLQVPCIFIFGDSLSDCGNNNNLATFARANFLPYGIDFPNGPTERFTNGRTTIDFISEELGFKNFIPPYANTSGFNILEGVNYASGAAGIRNETGTHAGPDISLELQLTNHKDIISKIAGTLGPDKAQQHLNKCLYYVNIGSNDYINNYFLPKYYKTSSTYTPEQYAEALIQQYSLQIRALHETRARKFALIGLGLVGCIPEEIIRHGINGSSACAEENNRAALKFNDKLKSLVDQFNKELLDAKFVYVDNAMITSSSPELSGMKGVTLRCCEVEEKTGQRVPNKTPCNNRNLHLFWDSFHPTEAVNKIMAKSAYYSSIQKNSLTQWISVISSSCELNKFEIHLFLNKYS